ncbi:MAG TPA: DinB family protein [Chitinophagaceae bacterium]|nr:DinB family protein [Chitinophagaceae bacterium]
MNQEKYIFVKTGILPLLEGLLSEAKGKWGKMNGQQMVEHLSLFFKTSSGRIHLPLVTPAEQLPKYREFLLSEKEFRENTKAPQQYIPEEPLPLRFANMQEALQALEKSIGEFFTCFQEDPEKKILHPVFGELNFGEWIQLHHKHVIHHLKQFGLIT